MKKFSGLILIVLFLLPMMQLFPAQQGNINLNLFIKTDGVNDNLNFETILNDWTSKGSACLSVARSGTRSHAGSYSLQMNYHLSCVSGSNEGFAEYVIGETNLTGKTLSVWLFCPTGSGGSCSYPNMVYLYAKDKEWDWADSGYKKIIDYVGSCIDHQNTWWNVTWTINSTGNFNSSNVKALGVKIAVPGTCQPIDKYTGPYYIDDISW